MKLNLFLQNKNFLYKSLSSAICQKTHKSWLIAQKVIKLHCFLGTEKNAHNSYNLMISVQSVHPSQEMDLKQFLDLKFFSKEENIILKSF